MVLTLWHGGRGLPSRGSGPARVDWHSTHASASRSSGSAPVPRSDGPGCAACRPRWSSPSRRPAPAARAGHPTGAAALARAGALLADRTDVVAALSRLRAEFGADVGGPAWGVARQREKARAAFGPTPTACCSPATPGAGRPPELADRRAARLLAGGATTAVDLGCAAGTETIALARAGAEVLAVDRDPVARELTGHNVAALGLTAQVRDADVVDLVAAARDGQVAGCAAAVLDPARRAGGAASWTPTAGPRPGRR